MSHKHRIICQERSEIDFSTEIASKVRESRASLGKLCVLVKNHVAKT
jgi:hypothetical protein